jgi:ribosomal protein S18 acetylase RimI-like enzyme
MNTEVFIRPFEAEDYEVCMELLAEAFQGKLGQLTGFDVDKLKKLMMDVGTSESQPFEGYYVAEVEGKVVGAMVLRWKNQEKPTVDDVVIDFHKIKAYGILPLIRFGLGMSLMKHSVEDRVCYVDHIAVDKHYRGLGIGSRLLDEAFRFAHEIEGVKALTLHVVASNSKAYDLYVRHGFKSIKKESSKIMKWLFNEEKWTYMMKNID